MSARLILCGALTLITQPVSAIPPALPPPPAEAMAIAVDLWRVSPIDESERSAALRTALSYLSTEALTRAGAENDRDYYLAHAALIERLAQRANNAQTQLNTLAVECLATPLAYSMTVRQLTDLREFVASESGRAFWRMHTRLRLVECLKSGLASVMSREIDADVVQARAAS